jgi:hypothetical protein
VLLREDDDAVIAIGQASHAWLSGQLARAWGGDVFAPPEPFEEVCLAATQHDIGMGAWDLSPQLQPESGLPRTFLEMQTAVHLELWGRAPRLLASQSAYAALLVSRHGTGLYGRVDLSTMDAGRATAIQAYLDDQSALQDALSAAVGADAAELDRNSALLAAWDRMSLALCLRWPGAEVGTAPTPDGGERELRMDPDGDHAAVLDPWPFVTPTLDVVCEGRRLTGRYASDEELHAALAAAPLVRVPFALRPA